MTIKDEDAQDPEIRQFYMIISLDEFFFDKPYEEFSKAVHTQITSAVVDLRQAIESAWLRHNNATPYYMDGNEDGT